MSRCVVFVAMYDCCLVRGLEVAFALSPDVVPDDEEGTPEDFAWIVEEEADGALLASHELDEATVSLLELHPWVVVS